MYNSSRVPFRSEERKKRQWSIHWVITEYSGHAVFGKKSTPRGDRTNGSVVVVEKAGRFTAYYAQ